MDGCTACFGVEYGHAADEDAADEDDGWRGCAGVGVRSLFWE